MSERSINLANAIGAFIILTLTLALAAAVALLAGCATTPPGPGPVTPPSPPGPAATCSDACARAVALRCTTDEQLCRDACARYAELGGASAWDVGAMTTAHNCAELDSAHGGGSE
jgi:uncharacterized lipoprotein YajG